jgi:hypothetical protein
MPTEKPKIGRTIIGVLGRTLSRTLPLWFGVIASLGAWWWTTPRQSTVIELTTNRPGNRMRRHGDVRTRGKDASRPSLDLETPAASNRWLVLEVRGAQDRTAFIENESGGRPNVGGAAEPAADSESAAGELRVVDLERSAVFSIVEVSGANPWVRLFGDQLVVLDEVPVPPTPLLPRGAAQRVRVLNPPTGSVQTVFVAESEGWVPDEERKTLCRVDHANGLTFERVDLLTGALRGKVKLAKRKGGLKDREINLATMSHAWSPDGRFLAVAEAWDLDRRVGPPRLEIFETATGRLLQVVSDHGEPTQRPETAHEVSDDVGAGMLEFVGADRLRFRPCYRIRHGGGTPAGPWREVRIVEPGPATAAPVETPSEPEDSSIGAELVRLLTITKENAAREPGIMLTESGTLAFRGDPDWRSATLPFSPDEAKNSVISVGATANGAGALLIRVVAQDAGAETVAAVGVAPRPPEKTGSIHLLPGPSHLHWFSRRDRTWERIRSLPPGVLHDAVLLDDRVALVIRDPDRPDRWRIEVWSLPPSPTLRWSALAGLIGLTAGCCWRIAWWLRTAASIPREPRAVRLARHGRGAGRALQRWRAPIAGMVVFVASAWWTGPKPSVVTEFRVDRKDVLAQWCRAPDAEIYGDETSVRTAAPGRWLAVKLEHSESSEANEGSELIVIDTIARRIERRLAITEPFRSAWFIGDQLVILDGTELAPDRSSVLDTRIRVAQLPDGPLRTTFHDERNGWDVLPASGGLRRVESGIGVELSMERVDLLTGRRQPRVIIPGRVGELRGSGDADRMCLDHAWSPDGRLLALAEGWQFDRRIGPPRLEIWDVTSGRLLQTVRDHGRYREQPETTSEVSADVGAGMLEFVTDDRLRFRPCYRIRHGGATPAGPWLDVRVVSATERGEPIETPSEPADHSFQHSTVRRRTMILGGFAAPSVPGVELNWASRFVSDRAGDWTLLVNPGRSSLLSEPWRGLADRLPQPLARLHRGFATEIHWQANEDAPWRALASLSSDAVDDLEVVRGGVVFLVRDEHDPARRRVEFRELPPPRWNVDRCLIAGLASAGLVALVGWLRQR